MPREAQLRRWPPSKGLYVPRFYAVTYATARRARSRRSSRGRSRTRAPPQVHKRIADRLPPTPAHQLVPNIDVVHNRAIVEIHRGCTRGCRFCQAGHHPPGARALRRGDRRAVAEIVDQTGYEDVALLSLSSADHSEIEAVIRRCWTRFAGPPLGSISLPSLRIDAFSVELADGLRTGAANRALPSRRRPARSDCAAASTRTSRRGGARRRRGGLRAGLAYAQTLLHDRPARRDRRGRRGHRRHGPPGAGIGRRVGGRKTEVHVNVGTFVPKPQTVFQWEPLADEETIRRRQQLLRRTIRGRGLRLSWNDYVETQLEALLTRGDRRLNAVVARAWELGARFDAWQDWRDFDAWQQAFEEHSVDPQFYLYRRRDPEELLPWDHLHSGVEKRFFWQDYERSLAGEFLNDCRERCHGCGILQNYPALRKETWQCPS